MFVKADKDNFEVVINEKLAIDHNVASWLLRKIKDALLDDLADITAITPEHQRHYTIHKKYEE